MRSFKTFSIVLLSCLSMVLSGQDLPLEGTRICLDPGHGGHDADDRPTDLGIGPIYYESDANWDAVLHLDTLLRSLGAEVKITKTTNDPEAPDRDPSLADRVQVANAFNSDYFHSFHTNGFTNPETNYSLVLYPGPIDGMADFDESIIMSDIMSEALFKAMRTTNTFSRADIPFTGFTNGLGVLNNLNMPGTLSEASFHSNLNEGRRLMNTDYRKSAAWAITKSFLSYFEVSNVETGQLGGVITNQEGEALNGIEVTLNPGTSEAKFYNGDQFLNGFYFFDYLEAGNYEVMISNFGYESQLQTVVISEGVYTELDAILSTVGGAPGAPTLLAIKSTTENNGLEVTWVQNPEVNLLGYRLYYAADDNLENWVLAADEELLSKDSSSVKISSTELFKVVPSKDIFHFKLTAVAESGAESGSSDIYSRIGGITNDRILIVDGFDRKSGSYKEDIHPFSANFVSGIRKASEVNVTSVANEYLINNPELAREYDLVFWFLGDESTADLTLSASEQDIISDYLNSGGKLFISGSEIGWDLDNLGSDNEKQFYRQYLKASYVGDGSTSFSPASGIGGGAFEDVFLDLGVVYPEDFPDEIGPESGAEAILRYSSPGGTAGIGYLGSFPGGGEEGGIVYLGFALETVSIAQQEQLLRDAFTYLGVGTEISSTNLEALEGDSWSMEVTPNPSSESPMLSLQNIPSAIKRFKVSIRNSSGLLLSESSHAVFSENQQIVLDGIQLPAGTYLITVSENSSLKTQIFVKL